MNDRPTKSTIDEMLDRAIRAITSGDRATANELASQVLAVDRNNPDAEELLANPVDSGEIRRLTMLFADLVDSTALSTRIDPEIYRTVVGRYRDEVIKVVNRYEGHLGSTQGDGLFAVFGHPTAHENDAHRAVQAGLDITTEVAALSERVRRRFGFDIDVRVGVHRGMVYLDVAQDDVYGLGANLAARLCSLAEPGTVAVSEAIERVVHDAFELQSRPPAPVKGVEESIVHYRVVAERDVTAIARGPLVGRERELRYLEDSWAQATAGTLTVPGVAFCGEGGIGKSRLAGAALDMAKESDAVVVDLYGSPFHTDVGLRPVRRLLERRSGIHRGSDPAESLRKLRAEVEKCGMNPDTAVPLLAPVLGIGPESGYQPAPAHAGKLYDQIAGAVKDYLLSCVGPGPGLVLVRRHPLVRRRHRRDRSGAAARGPGQAPRRRERAPAARAVPGTDLRIRPPHQRRSRHLDPRLASRDETRGTPCGSATMRRHTALHRGSGCQAQRRARAKRRIHAGAGHLV